jgi:hypothetical protein
MALGDDLERIAAAVSDRGEVAGVLAAEPAHGLRYYLVALGVGDERRWLVLDEGGRAVDRRDEVRDVSSRSASWRPILPAAATSTSCA